MSGIIPAPARVLRGEGTYTLPAQVRFGGAVDAVGAPVRDALARINALVPIAASIAVGADHAEVSMPRSNVGGSATPPGPSWRLLPIWLRSAPVGATWPLIVCWPQQEKHSRPDVYISSTLGSWQQRLQPSGSVDRTLSGSNHWPRLVRPPSSTSCTLP